MIYIYAFSTCVSFIFSICAILILNGFCAFFCDAISFKNILFTFLIVCLSCAFSSFFSSLIENETRLFFILLILEHIFVKILQDYLKVCEDSHFFHEVLPLSIPLLCQNLIQLFLCHQQHLLIYFLLLFSKAFAFKQELVCLLPNLSLQDLKLLSFLHDLFS